MFSNTGWRIGWAISTPELLWPIRAQFSIGQISAPTPLQVAFAIGLENEVKVYGSPQSYIYRLQEKLVKTRNRLVSILRKIGADVRMPTGSVVVMANFTNIFQHVPLVGPIDFRPGMRLFNYFVYMLVSIMMIHSDQLIGEPSVQTKLVLYPNSFISDSFNINNL